MKHSSNLILLCVVGLLAVFSLHTPPASAWDPFLPQHRFIECPNWSPEHIAFDDDVLFFGEQRLFISIEVTDQMLTTSNLDPPFPAAPFLIDFSAVTQPEALRNARLPAEWEPKKALLVSNGNKAAEGILEALDNVRDKPPVFVLASEEQISNESHYQRSTGDAVEKHPIKNGNAWPRDNTGLFVEFTLPSGKKDLCLLQNKATTANLCNAKDRSLLPCTCPVSVPANLQGGFFLSDGSGTCATTEKWFKHAAIETTPLQKADLLRSYLGCQRVLVLAPNRDGTGHIDMIFKFLPQRGVMAAYLDMNDSTHSRFNDNIRFLRWLQSKGVFQDVYPVYLPKRAIVPTDQKGKCSEFLSGPFPYPPLLNAYLLDDETALVPQFHLDLVFDWPEETQAIWNQWWDDTNQRILEEFKTAGFKNVLPTDATSFIRGGLAPKSCSNLRGGIHCSMTEVPSLRHDK